MHVIVWNNAKMHKQKIYCGRERGGVGVERMMHGFIHDLFLGVVMLYNDYLQKGMMMF